MKLRPLLAGLLACLAVLSVAALTRAADPAVVDDATEAFLLRPAVEKAYGYTHAIRIGNDA